MMVMWKKYVGKSKNALEDGQTVGFSRGLFFGEGVSVPNPNKMENGAESLRYKGTMGTADRSRPFITTNSSRRWHKAPQRSCRDKGK